MDKMDERETKQLQDANAMQDEIFARAEAAGWRAAYVSGPREEGQPDYGPDMPVPGYAFERDEMALFVRWYPASHVSIVQVLDWIETLP
jgi:hypothetical protein